MKRIFVTVLLASLLQGASWAQLEADSLDAAIARGSLSLERGEWESARADAARALELSPDSFEALLLMGRALEPTQPKRAIPFLDRALALQPDSVVAVRAKIAALFALKQTEQAQALLKQSLEQHPLDASLYFTRAHYSYVGQETLSPEAVALVLADLETAQKLAPNVPDYWAVAGWVRFQYAGKNVAALADYTKALRLQQRANDLKNRALLLRAMKQPERAVSDLKAVLRATDVTPALKEEAIRLLTEMGHPPEEKKPEE